MADELPVAVNHVAARVLAVLRALHRLPILKLLHREGGRGIRLGGLVRIARRLALRSNRGVLLSRLGRRLLALLLALGAALGGRGLCGLLLVALASRLGSLVRLARRLALRGNRRVLLGRLGRRLLALLLALGAALGGRGLCGLLGLRLLGGLGRGHPAAELLDNLRVRPRVVGGVLRLERGGELHDLGRELLEHGVVRAGGGHVQGVAHAAQEEKPRGGLALLRLLGLGRLLLLRLGLLGLLGGRRPGAELGHDLRVGPGVVLGVLGLEEGGELHHGRLLRAAGDEQGTHAVVEHNPRRLGLLGVAGGGHLGCLYASFVTCKRGVMLMGGTWSSIFFYWRP